MNQKTAFKILGLSPGASMAQAKKAFRDLAKQYHPDLNASDKIGDVQASVRMDRMKQINQAFHFLATLLPKDNGVPGDIPKEKSAPGNTNFSLLDILQLFKKFFKSRVTPKTGVKQPPFGKPGVRQGRRAGQAARFDEILQSLYSGARPAADKKSKAGARDSRIQPYANFIKYMDTKHKIDARARRGGEQNSHRVERIRPVPRVNPMGDNNNS
ncbi:MAG: DnaJ domain-containing protein [Proteobacteria bacterium]|nr:hypothetical protein [Desulfobacula sp.]MBU3953688.1 DnaJ domain-containing protein [Pseudomonadota bacterium]MBU4129630.1 DnaJ domain-containing protein [Pseudomonadota bacterium]